MPHFLLSVSKFQLLIVRPVTGPVVVQIFPPLPEQDLEEVQPVVKLETAKRLVNPRVTVVVRRVPWMGCPRSLLTECLETFLEVVVNLLLLQYTEGTKDTPRDQRQPQQLPLQVLILMIMVVSTAIRRGFATMVSSLNV